MNWTDKIQVFREDCKEVMKRYPDNYFDLAIVDPPYKIGKKLTVGGGSHTKSKSKFHQRYKENGKTWDNQRPDSFYWNELFRISKNQIVFGGNYFCNDLPVSRGWFYWHKQGEKMSSVNDELGWTSFDISIKKFSRCHGRDKGFLSDHKVFHPTTKPTALYKWVLNNYAKEGDKIFDSHFGSGSISIASHDLKFDLVGCEIDQEYYDLSYKRFKNHAAQLQIF